MKCKELMINDWASDKYGYLMQITVIGDGYVSFEDDEGNLCQLDDKCNQPEPIPLTYEILKKNGWTKASNLETALSSAINALDEAMAKGAFVDNPTSEEAEQCIVKINALDALLNEAAEWISKL